MPAVASIQAGALTVVAADGLTKDVTISSVDTSKALVMFTHRNADVDGRDLRHLFTAHLTSATNLRFTRNASASATQVDIEWTVIEFTDSAVQAGSIDCDATTETISITQVDPDRSFVVSSALTDLLQGRNTFAHTVKIDGTGENVVIKTNTTPGAGDLTVRWQVVQLPTDSAAVQTITIALANTDITKTASISAVDLAKTFLANGGCLTSASLGDGGRHMSLTKINSTTEIEARRQNVGTVVALDAVTQVVELLDNSTVESGVATIANAATTPTQPTFGELTDGAVMATYIRVNQRSTHTADPRPTNLYATIKLDSPPDGLTIQRVGSTGPLEVAWFVVAWAGAGLTEEIAPNTVLATSNLQDTSFNIPPANVNDIDEDPASPDSNWWTAVNPGLSTAARVGFASPTMGTPVGTQTFYIWVRKTTGTQHPTVDVELWENGSFVATLLNDVEVTSTSGQLLTATFNAQGSPPSLTNPADVEIRLVSTPGVAP